jgi:hypothetical protein
MIIADTVIETINVYQRYGWVLRRLQAPGAVIDELDGEILDARTATDEFGCAWFSRPPAGGAIAWELRYLGEPPYALVEHLDEDSPEFESQLGLIEGRLREIILDRRTA